MLLILLIGLGLSGASFVLVARAAVMPRLRASETLDHIGAYGFSSQQAESSRSSAARGAVDGVAAVIGGVAGRLGSFREANLRRELVAAGIYGLAPRKFLGYRILCALCLPAAWLWLASTGGYSAVITVLAVPMALAMGWTAPMTIVKRRSRRRFDEIDYELPEPDRSARCDRRGRPRLHRVTPARRRTVRRSARRRAASDPSGAEHGPVDERGAPESARARDTPLMRSFVRSVLQGETLGVSIGEIMRNLAVDMRKRRRQAAEERAQKAPIKLLFPLIFLIFPAMFVILLGPAVFSFLEAFGG